MHSAKAPAGLTLVGGGSLMLETQPPESVWKGAVGANTVPLTKVQ